MYAKRLQEGNYIDHTPVSPLAPGDVVVIGDQCYVCERDIAAGELGALAATGIFEVAKAAPLEISAGDSVYWNASSHTLSKTSSDVYFGKSTGDAASADTTVKARLISPEVREASSLGDLDDVGDTTATAGNLLIADGSDFVAGKPTDTSVHTTAEGALGIPVIISKTLTAAGAEDETIIASTTTKLRILEAFFYARDTNAANVTLKAGSASLTDAKAKGTNDGYKVEWLSLIAADKIVAAGTELKVTFSAAGSIEVVIIAVVAA